MTTDDYLLLSALELQITAHRPELKRVPADALLLIKFTLLANVSQLSLDTK